MEKYGIYFVKDYGACVLLSESKNNCNVVCPVLKCKNDINHFKTISNRDISIIPTDMITVDSKYIGGYIDSIDISERERFSREILKYYEPELS